MGHGLIAGALELLGMPSPPPGSRICIDNGGANAVRRLRRRIWTDIRTAVRDTGVNARAGHPPGMISPENTGDRNAGLPASSGPAKPPGGGAVTGGIPDLAGLTPEEAWRRLSAGAARGGRR